MPNTTKGSPQGGKRKSGLRGADLRKFRNDVSRLKAKGLVSDKVDARSQKPTKHMRSQVRKFSDVLEGKAKVVKLPRKEAAKYRDPFRVKNSRVVIPVESKSERVRYNPKKHQIETHRRAYERNIKKVVRPRPKDIGDLPRGPNFRYTIPFANGGRTTFDSPEELARFMMGYGTFKNWIKYVEVEEIEPGDDGDEISEAA